MCKKHGRKSVLTRRLKTSSLSSLSSLKGCFLVEDQWLGILAFCQKIVPEKADIVPIVPEKNRAAQYAASDWAETTTSCKWGMA
jgi:hypothetical protein